MHDLAVSRRTRMSPARAYATVMALSVLLPMRDAVRLREAAYALRPEVPVARREGGLQ